MSWSVGRHGLPTPTPTVRVAVLLAAALTWLVLVLRQLPCRSLPGREPADRYQAMCYSDIPLLYRLRGLVDGYTPYLDAGEHRVLEYPVLTGALLELQRLVVVALGAPVGPGLGEDDALRAADLFMGVNVVLLGLLFAVVVLAQLATVPGRPGDAMWVAASPCVAAAGLINWDLLAVALTSLALLAWSRSRPGLAGVAIGLGAAAKVYPLLLLGPLLLLCLRAGRRREAVRLLVTAAAAWLAVNLPVLLLAPAGWQTFWQFNAERDGEFGSLWYVLRLAGAQPPVNLLSFGLLVLLCAGIAVLCLAAPRRPRVGQVAFLVVVAFLLTAKVYSPQYVLWLLPLLVLARPRAREWIVFTVGELVYFAGIWLHLGGWLDPGDGGPDVAYWFAVLLRLACQSFVAAVVARDILAPGRDPLRTDGADDPAGGVLDRAPDVWRWPRPTPAEGPRPGMRPAEAGRTVENGPVGDGAEDPHRPAGEGVPIGPLLDRIRAGGRGGKQD